MVVAGLVLGAPSARAAPQTVAGQEVRPPVAIVTRGEAPTELLDAIAFELDQAGYAVVANPTARVAATIHVGLDGERYRIEIDNHARGVTVDADAAEDSVALLSVELLVASSVKTPESEPEPRPEPERRAPTKERVTQVETHEHSGVLRAVAPAPQASATAWSVGIGLTAASIGPVGVALDVHRDWSRATVGLGLEGAVLAGSTVDVDEEALREIDAGGLMRTGLFAAFVARPGRRVRPSVGAGTELMVPFVRSRYLGPDPARPDTVLDANGTNAGLFFVPTASLGLRIAVRERSALSLGVRAGPRVALVPIQLVDGTTYPTPPWFFAATIGMRFGLG